MGRFLTKKAEKVNLEKTLHQPFIIKYEIIHFAFFKSGFRTVDFVEYS